MEAGEIAEADPDVIGWALMGIAELFGIRDALAGHSRVGARRAGGLHRPRTGGEVTRVGIVGTAAYLPDRWMTAAEVASASGIPEGVVVEKFGLRGKHIAATDEHVSDLAVAAGQRLLDDHDVDPASIDVVVYYGSQWKDYAVWQAAPWIAHRLGCVNAFALEFDNVSHGTPVALRLCRDYLAAEPELRRVLAVAASRESYLLDYTNERSRFMFNFGDGAAAALIERDHPANEILALARDHRRVAVTAGEGAVRRQRRAAVDGRRQRQLPPRRRRPGGDEGAARRHEPRQLRRRLGERARQAPGATLADVSLLCRHSHEAVDARRRARPARRRSGARAVPRRHRPHERRRPAAGARPRRRAPARSQTATSSCCSPPAPATPGRPAVVRWGPA